MAAEPQQSSVRGGECHIKQKRPCRAANVTTKNLSKVRIPGLMLVVKARALLGLRELRHWRTPYFPKSGENWIIMRGVLQCSIPRRNPVVSTVTRILGITPCRLPWPFYAVGV